MKAIFGFLLLAVVLADNTHKYSDLCYRFDHPGDNTRRTAQQIYTDKHGKLLSSDVIVEQGLKYVYTVSYYYHYNLTNCQPVESGMRCNRTCESVWFKFINTTGMYTENIPKCDPIFQKKYANVMEHDCPGNPDFLYWVRQRIGTGYPTTIKMKDGKPTIPGDGYKEIKECVWEYDILGLISVVTLWIIGGIALIALLLAILLIVFVQKHRATKRKHLENSLLKQQKEEVALAV